MMSMLSHIPHRTVEINEQPTKAETAKQDKASSPQIIAVNNESEACAQQNASTLLSACVVPTRDLKKKNATGFYLVRTAAASSVVVSNPGEPQVINDHLKLLSSSQTHLPDTPSEIDYILTAFYFTLYFTLLCSNA